MPTIDSADIATLDRFAIRQRLRAMSAYRRHQSRARRAGEADSDG